MRGKVIKEEKDFSDNTLQGAIALRHYNQPLAYFDTAGNFRLKGKVLKKQPPMA